MCSLDMRIRISHYVPCVAGYLESHETLTMGDRNAAHTSPGYSNAAHTSPAYRNAERVHRNLDVSMSSSSLLRLGRVGVSIGLLVC